MIPARFAPIVFGFVLSGMMTFLVSALSTFRAVGLADGVFALWMSNWMTSWVIGFPIVLFVGPMSRRFVDRLTIKEP